jgi:hypothetical protein
MIDRAADQLILQNSQNKFFHFQNLETLNNTLKFSVVADEL